MKYRKDFVTNSSSSSFVISKAAITDEQKEKIFKYFDFAKEIMPDAYIDANWVIDENEYFVFGDTIIDNFDMREYLKLIGVPEDGIKFKWD